MIIFNISKFISLIVLFLCLFLGLNFNLDLIETKFGYSLDNLPSWFSFFASNNFIWVLFVIILISVIDDFFLIKSNTLSVISNTLSVLLLTVLLLKVIDPSFIDIIINNTKLLENRVALWREVYNSEILKLYGSARPELLEKLNIFREGKSREIITFLGQDFFTDMTLTQIKESAVKSAGGDLKEFLDNIRRVESEFKPTVEVPLHLIVGAVSVVLAFGVFAVMSIISSKASEQALEGQIEILHARIDKLILDSNSVFGIHQKHIDTLFMGVDNLGLALGGLKDAYITAIVKIYNPLIMHSAVMGRCILKLACSPQVVSVVPSLPEHAQSVVATMAALSMDFPVIP